MTLNEFRKRFEKTENNIPSAFMRVSAAKWLEITAKKYGKDFKPDIERILSFSDADKNYKYDYEAAHTSINPNVTVGEMLRIAYELIMDSYYQQYNDTEKYCQMMSDALYIVNCLMVYPFTKTKSSV